jgi:hypothetical protein
MSTVPTGTVLERPTGTEAIAWQLYAAALEKHMKLQRTIARLKRKAAK